MLSYEEMPDDNREPAKLYVKFPRMEPDSEESSPASMDEIKEYLAMESPVGDAVWKTKLNFLRTAYVAAEKYWIWELHDADGRHCYVTVSTDTMGRVTIGYDQNWAKLTPEQFMLGDYHNVF